MTAAVPGVNVISFTTGNGATPQALTTTAFMRTVTVDNQTSVTAYVNVSGGTASSAAPSIAVPTNTTVMIYMQDQLPNANTNPGNTAALYENGPVVSTAGVFTTPDTLSGAALDQSESWNWTVQSAGQTGQISVVLASNPAANSAVVLTVEG